MTFTSDILKISIHSRKGADNSTGNLFHSRLAGLMTNVFLRLASRLFASMVAVLARNPLNHVC